MDGWINVARDGVAPLWMQHRPTGVILNDGRAEVFVTRDQLATINGMIAREEKGYDDDPGAA